MKVILKDCSGYLSIIDAIRLCHSSSDKKDSSPVKSAWGKNDLKLVRSVIDKGHESTLEHSCIIFEVQGMSRACLQEFVRHRIGIGYSVESTRYTLKKLLKNKKTNLTEMVHQTGNEKVDALVEKTMKELVNILQKDPTIANDVLKYALPEAYLCNLMVTYNFRSLRSFVRLRCTQSALPEIRKVSTLMFYNMRRTALAPLFADLDTLVGYDQDTLDEYLRSEQIV